MTWKAMAIDGPGGSGKSTLARQLAKDLGAYIIPMDAFLLPATNYRLSAISKNYDLDRFGQDVIDPIMLGANQVSVCRFENRKDEDREGSGRKASDH